MELQGFIILIKYRLLIQSSSHVNRTSHCTTYRYPGIPSFPREQELMKNQRTEHLSAYDP
jgi:hypothetical protein